MTFISYAQNYEDVMLRRALKDVDNGFYIDVGANDPVIDSVTKAFYDVGWRGINIEPVTEWFEKLQQDRQGDINLQFVVGACKGEGNFYEVVGTGLSTTDKLIAKRHEHEYGHELKKYEIPIVALTSICEQYSRQNIHFLKIDVEGGELGVLQGLDLKKIRPWIILVESTLPNSQIENYDEWEHTLTKRGYHYVYFDGLNRYYVADERSQLDDAFKVPPNYFDHFKRANELKFERMLDEHWAASNARIQELISELNREKSNAEKLIHSSQNLELTLGQWEEELGVAKVNIEELIHSSQNLEFTLGQREEELGVAKIKLEELILSLHLKRLDGDHLVTELQAIRNSKSWRITWPLRKLMKFSNGVHHFLARLIFWFMRLPRYLARWFLVKFIAYGLKNIKLKILITAWLRKYPKLDARLRSMAQGQKHVVRKLRVSDVLTSELSDMAPSARKIYGRLKAEMIQKQKENL
jgi:FkbM family methyltransferase